jgi:hypothetical protein
MNPGVELKPTSTSGISRAVVIDVTRRSDLTWDRYARLHRTAESIRQVVQKSEVILDVGGYDGALALFLPEHHIDVLDPITTGGTALSITAEPYEAVVSIDALEHVPPENRDTFLIQLSKLGRRACFINFPSAATGCLAASKSCLCQKIPRISRIQCACAATYKFGTMDFSISSPNRCS